MKFSLAAKVALGAALTLTLGGKLASGREAAPPDAALFSSTADLVFKRVGFSEGRRHDPSGRVQYFDKDACRSMVADYSPYGTFANVIEDLGRPVGRFRFRYRARWYDRAPKLLPLFEFYAERELGRIGILTRRHPIIAVAENGRCDLEALDWGRLTTLQR